MLPSLFDVVWVLKSLTTRMARPFLGENPLWQRSYHEHVIRNEEDYRQVWEYIDTNPARWAEDRYDQGKSEQGRVKSCGVRFADRSEGSVFEADTSFARLPYGKRKRDRLR